MARNENNNCIQMDFLEVCSFGDLEKAKAMLKNGKVDKNFQHHGNGWTALHWAARRNHQEIVELLLRAGFDPKLPAKDGKTPLDLVTSEAVKEILIQSENINANQEDTHSLPIKHEIYSNGKLDSLNHTRFLLVRTNSRALLNIDPFQISFSIGNTNESFKRVVLHGCCSVDVLKLTIERAMKKGRVLDVITLPDKVKIKTEQQIRDLASHQKVEVVFSPAEMNEEMSCAQKLSSDEDKITRSEHEPMLEKLEKEFVGLNTKYLNESTSCERSVDDVVSLSEISNSVDDSNVDVDDSFNRLNGSGSVPKEHLMHTEISEVAVTSECALTAQSSNSSADIIFPSKILAEEMIKMQIVSLQQNNNEINTDKSVLMPESERKQDYKSAESETMIGTESVKLALSSEIDVNGSAVSYIAKSDFFGTIQEEWARIIVKDVSHKRTLQIALLIGCVVGFGGLTYMLYKK
ncbi:ankyrin repeat protein [Onchocerca flexuosa]|uniref:Ankyrin repeat protein n=1 Tax=Onchocerca flexuosa TaxID=387005 RepID=A0A238BRE9_9BILA|nr:ankyrin repeat protein [Onchocerca flexuosa]